MVDLGRAEAQKMFRKLTLRAPRRFKESEMVVKDFLVNSFVLIDIAATNRRE